MTAGGNEISVRLDSRTCYFSEMRIEVINTSEKSGVVGGGIYRVRGAACEENLYLKCRIEHSEAFAYRELLTELASGEAKTLIITSGGKTAGFTGYCLKVGRITAAEQEGFSVCEIYLMRERV